MRLKLSIAHKFSASLLLFLALLAAMAGLLYYSITSLNQRTAQLADFYAADHHIMMAEAYYDELDMKIDDFIVLRSDHEKVEVMDRANAIQSHYHNILRLPGFKPWQRRLIERSQASFNQLTTPIKELLDSEADSRGKTLVAYILKRVIAEKQVLIRVHNASHEEENQMSTQLAVAKNRVRSLATLFIVVATAIALVQSWRFSRMITGRIAALTMATEMLRQGRPVPKLATGWGDEIGQLIKGFNKLSHDLETSKRLADRSVAAKKRTVERLITINQIVKASAELPLKDLLEKTVRRFSEMPKAAFALIHLAERGGEVLTLTAEGGLPAEARASLLRVSAGQGIIGSVAQARREISLGKGVDLRKAVPWLASTAEGEALLAELKSVHCLPLVVDDIVLGVLSVALKTQLDPEDVALMESIAFNLALAINSAELLSYQQQTHGELSAIHRVTDVSLSRLDLDSLLTSLLGRVVEATGMESGAIFVLDHDELVLKTSSDSGSGKTKLSKEDVEQLVVFAQNVIRTGKPFALEDVASSAVFLKDRTTKLGSLVAVPLQVEGGEVIGVVQVFGPESREFADKDINLVQILAERVSAAIAYAEASLDRNLSEQKYLTLFNSTQDAIWLATEKGKVLAANKPAAELSGYGDDAVPRLSLADLFTEESVGRIFSASQEQLVSREPGKPMDLTLRTSDGRQQDVLAVVSLLFKADKLAAIQVVAGAATAKSNLQKLAQGS